MSTAALQLPVALNSDVVRLHDVSWEQYCQFRESADNRGVRMYSADGDLLLMRQAHSTNGGHG